MIEMIFATGIPFGGRAELPRTLREMAALTPRTAGIRRLGSAALDLAYVAAGRVDGYWERGLNPWDMAAGILLVREAGGFVGTARGRRRHLRRRRRRRRQRQRLRALSRMLASGVTRAVPARELARRRGRSAGRRGPRRRRPYRACRRACRRRRISVPGGGAAPSTRTRARPLRSSVLCFIRAVTSWPT